MFTGPTMLALFMVTDTPPRSGDLATVSLARSGDISAFKRLYHANVGRVYALCLRMVGDAGRSEELAQDAFVRAWEMLGNYRGDSAFSTWLHRLTVNVVLVALRSERRRTSHEKTDDFEMLDAPENTPSHGTRLDLEDAIASLPPGARAIFTLHDIEGFKHDEIAEQMGLAVGTCKAQLHRARKLLKEILE
ncbi:MAG TPA: RNA polymerase sigma factor [Bacteroidota bacterium]|nr:RNA polymerase sigma factor [Bacteroidota bacterium]